MNQHYLFELADYLEANNLSYKSPLNILIQQRKSGKKFINEEHLKALIYSLLSNQRKWSGIVPNLAAIDKIFFNYDFNKVKCRSGTYFAKKISSIKCGNRMILKQMNSLKNIIEIIEDITFEFGSMDAFVTSLRAPAIVCLLSSDSSPYKLPNIGISLAWEYLRNVGIDGAKPDVHLNRFLGSGRMGISKKEISTIGETLSQVKTLSRITGLSMVDIDGIIWSFCSDGFGEICTQNPKCEECPLYNKGICHCVEKA